MDTIKDKIKNLDQRISDVSDQIKDLQQTKVNLMMLKRDLGMKDVEITLEDCLSDELRKLLTDHFTKHPDEIDDDQIDRSHRN